MTKDWRLENLEDPPRLRDVSFVRKPYREYRPGWDHDHCAGCWTKLAEPELIQGDDIVHEGYATTSAYEMGAEYVWVCVTCFQLFREDMGWRDVTGIED